jgi:hypothetical protein
MVDMEINQMTKLQKAQTEVSLLWVKMCAEEGGPTDSKFVVFTSTNKYSLKYNTAVKKFFRLKSNARPTKDRTDYMAAARNAGVR